jgi:hypothetical protein
MLTGFHAGFHSLNKGRGISPFSLLGRVFENGENLRKYIFGTSKIVLLPGFQKGRDIEAS